MMSGSAPGTQGKPRRRRAQAGFTDVEVRDRPSWLAREHALWEEAVTLDPGDDPALRSLHAEGVKSLQWTAVLRRVPGRPNQPSITSAPLCRGGAREAAGPCLFRNASRSSACPGVPCRVFKVAWPSIRGPEVSHPHPPPWPRIKSAPSRGVRPVASPFDQLPSPGRPRPQRAYPPLGLGGDVCGIAVHRTGLHGTSFHRF